MAKSKSTDAAEQRRKHRCWYEFLKHNPEYKRTCENNGRGKYSELYRDFGDIFSIPFDKWYTDRYEDLFDPRPFRFVEIRDIEDFKHYASDKDGAVIAAINLEVSNEDLQEALPEFLRSFKVKKRGRPAGHRLPFARYPLRGGPDASTLEKALRVYELKRAHQDLKIWQIGQLAFAPRRERAIDLSRDLAEKHRYGVLASRYLKMADALIQNAAINCFPIPEPVHDPSQHPTYYTAVIAALKR